MNNNIKNKPHMFFYFFALFSVFLSIAIYFDVIPNIDGEIKNMLIYSELAGAFVLFILGKYLESKNKTK